MNRQQHSEPRSRGLAAVCVPAQPTEVTPADQLYRVLALFAGPLKQAEIVETWSAAQNPTAGQPQLEFLRSRCSARHHRSV